MRISIWEPLTPAIERMMWVTFRPFDASKWIHIGFCAWLAHVGEGAFGFLLNFVNLIPYPQPSSITIDDVHDWAQSMQDNLYLIIAIMLVLSVIGTAVYLVQRWITSRGMFMLLDNVLLNRPAVTQPWREHKQAGNSLFKFRLVLDLIAFNVWLVLAVACVLIAVPEVIAVLTLQEDASLGKWSIIAATLFVLGTIATWIGYMVAWTLTDDLVVPTMYQFRLTAWAAWKLLYRQFIRPHFLTLLGYLFARMLIFLAVVSMATILTCVTCYLAALPFLGSVLMLPLIVFLRSYPIYFVQQFGPDWQMTLERKEPDPTTRAL